MTPNADEITVEWIVDLTVRLVADEQGTDPVALLAGLEELGGDLPIDSQLLVEILTQVEAICGVSIPASKAVASSMQSVHAFAEMVVGLITGEQGAGLGAASATIAQNEYPEGKDI